MADPEKPGNVVRTGCAIYNIQLTKSGREEVTKEKQTGKCSRQKL
jgi:hypothetical protein